LFVEVLTGLDDDTY